MTFFADAAQEILSEFGQPAEYRPRDGGAAIPTTMIFRAPSGNVLVALPSQLSKSEPQISMSTPFALASEQFSGSYEGDNIYFSQRNEIWRVTSAAYDGQAFTTLYLAGPING